ncbi:MULTISPECIES: TlpA family protein disulfide reductase [Paenarthrobacter]|uniref:TlpA family protein disulfide reductase n=1 Tax=Paenarthrobacter TaxID=1742992 RepID=UPI000B2BAEA4|nr:TlpA disulfide reductase family protein [Paenarthrobacter nitroguajacolicus]NWL12028.1 TlpA family protein disulfide reductase [Paenarthrobacter nitroguajacolicus]NWL32196.1 TlpA family protein disulfide reductase [Paenarthrobacter nitroguajacolicus]
MDNNLSRRGVLTAGGVLLAGLTMGLSACAQEDSLAKQAKAGDNKNYVAGDGSVTEFAKADRAAPVALKGTLFNGQTVKPEDLLGKVTVLNFWFAACAPCRIEAPQLEALHLDFKDQGVQFFGVNLRDEQATAEAFDKTFNITYPSFNDKDGAVLLSVSGIVPPGAVPTTLVLDKEGKVASRVLGEIEKSTLKALITSAVAE